MSKISKYLWWQTGVVYQIYPRSFKDTIGNGIGDLKGVTEQMDYLGDILGVDAIWLSPFYPSPMADFGYDVADYQNVDPLFGDLGDFVELVDQAHQRDIKVIIDFVPNHTSDQHPWFIEARSSRNNSKRNWYVWKDAAPDGSPPNNWLSVFGGSTWEWDDGTSQYYLHSFLKQQPELNWRCKDVREAMFEVARFWLEMGVDGFRVDVAHYIMKDPLFRNNPIVTEGKDLFHRSRGDYDKQHHIYDKGHPDVHQIFREFRGLLDQYSQDSPRVSIGEIHLFDWDEWASYYGDALDEFHLAFNFSMLKVDWDARSIHDTINAIEKAIPKGAWPNYVLGNHDESRFASRTGSQFIKLGAMLLLSLRGTPTIYYGDELGMADVQIAKELQQDPWGVNVPGMSRDPCRTPMQWSPDIHAGFSPPEVQATWLSVSPDYSTQNVETQLADPLSVLIFYRKLLETRKNHPSLMIGNYYAEDSIDDNCLVYYRECTVDVCAIALNFSAKEQIVTLKDKFVYEVLVSTFQDRHREIGEESILLRPYEGVILGKK